MTTRTTETEITFRRPFMLRAFDARQPAGTYRLVVDEEEIFGLSFLAYRRMATMLHIPAISVQGERHQVVEVDPEELAAALDADALASHPHKEQSFMQYLGGIHGAGVLKRAGKALARADYDFDGFLRKPGEVIGSGEIRTSPDTLRQVFGREDLYLLTDDGWLLSLRFSEKHLPEASDAAHVDVAGDLPPQSEWRH